MSINDGIAYRLAGVPEASSYRVEIWDGSVWVPAPAEGLNMKDLMDGFQMTPKDFAALGIPAEDAALGSPTVSSAS